MGTNDKKASAQSVDLVLQIYPKNLQGVNSKLLEESFAGGMALPFFYAKKFTNDLFEEAKVVGLDGELGLLRLKSNTGTMGDNSRAVQHHFITILYPKWQLAIPLQNGSCSSWVSIIQPALQVTTETPFLAVESVTCGYLLDHGSFVETQTDVFPLSDETCTYFTVLLALYKTT